jgi:peptidoglycan/LPS O-acetylase OafA/YrhL
MLDDKEMTNFNYRKNNLNLIRLVAALQVLVGHLSQEFSVPSFTFLHAFKGVTIFFTLSGFLIFWSFDNNPNLRQYWKNRCLRILPAMIVALLCAIVLMLLLGVIKLSVLGNFSFWLWIGTQLTFIQEFTPSILHGFGNSNNPNPVLWTISVEMLLYMFIPLLYHWIKRYSRKGKTIVLLIIGLFSYCQNQTGFISTFLHSISDNGYWNIFIHAFC